MRSEKRFLEDWLPALLLEALLGGLGRAASTVSQEVFRHGGRRRYRAAEADVAAWDSARRPKLCVLANKHELQLMIASNLRRVWWPQQISGKLRSEYSERPEM